MPPTDRLLAFALTAFIVIVIPGPSVLFVVSRALGGGRRVAVLSVGGNALGEYVQVVAVAFGVGTLAERSVVAFSVLKVAGGAYLLYLGIKTFRGRRSLAATLGAPAIPPSDLRAFGQGLIVGVTDPKTVVFLAAILPQFTSGATDSLSTQILLLGLVFSGIALACDTIWACSASAFRGWFARSPRRLELLGGSGGIAIAAIGAGLLVTGHKD